MARRKSVTAVLSKSCGKEQCCPVIKVACRMVKKGKVTETFVGKDGKTRKYQMESSAPQKICTVTVGNKVHVKDVPSAESGKSIAALKRTLDARRCRTVVRSKGVQAPAAS